MAVHSGRNDEPRALITLYRHAFCGASVDFVKKNTNYGPGYVDHLFSHDYITAPPSVHKQQLAVRNWFGGRFCPLLPRLIIGRILFDRRDLCHRVSPIELPLA